MAKQEKSIKDFEMEITRDLVIEAVRFAIEKFRFDIFRRSGLSAKSSQIGEYIDRWISKTFENTFMSYILKEAGRDYRAYKDMFLYSNQIDKNAPDLLGLVDQKGEVLSIFSKFVKDEWVAIEGSPQLEIKTFKQHQRLFTVKDTQVDDNSIFISFIWDISPEYLELFLDDELFQKMEDWTFDESSKFVEEDAEEYLSLPKKSAIEPPEDFGCMKLGGVWTGKDIKKHAHLTSASPRWIKNVEEVGSIFRKGKMDKIEKVYNPGIDKFEENRGDLFEDEEYMPAYAEFIEETKVEIHPNFKSSTYFKSSAHFKLGEWSIEPGKIYKAEWKPFDRTSGWREYVIPKYNLPILDINQLDELLEEFDKAVESELGL